MAVAPLPEIIPTAQCFALVERLCDSAQLRRSPRLCEFLRYVCRRVLVDSVTDIREQEIGERVFRRGGDYETGLDPIVRVQASHLRKKLAQYFEGEGLAEPVVLEIPKGGYLPTFRQRAEAVVASPMTLTAEPEAPRAPRPGRSMPILTATLGFLCLVLAACCAWLFFRGERAPAPPELASRRYEYMLWSRLFSKGQNTTVVVADSGLGVIANWTGHPIDLKTYLTQDFNQWLGGVKPNLKERRILETMNDRFYTTGADLQLVRKISGVAAAFPDYRLSVVFGKSYHMRQANTDNVVLLGTSRVNPWVELFDRYLNFTMVYDETAQQWHVQDRAPAAGEPAVYRIQGEVAGVTEGYAIVAFLPNLARSGNVLILSGSDMDATEAAGELTLTEAKLAPALERMFPGIGNGKRELPYFEVLLKTRRFRGDLKEYKVESWRRIVLQNNQ